MCYIYNKNFGPYFRASLDEPIPLSIRPYSLHFFIPPPYPRASYGVTLLRSRPTRTLLNFSQIASFGRHLILANDPGVKRLLSRRRHRSRLPGGASIVTRLPTGVPAYSKYPGAPFVKNTSSLIAAFLPIERVDPFPVIGKSLRPAVVAQPAQFLVPPAVLSHLTYLAVAEAVDFLPAPPEPRALSP